MKNVIICKQCSAENPFFRHICRNCNSYLRERVVNIDLWHILSLLIESPGKAFRQIIYSEHKNFIFLIIFLTSIKLTINSSLIASAFGNIDALNNFFRNYLIIAAGFGSLIYLSAFLISKTTRKENSYTRVKDNFALIAYSFTPHVFALVFLFPIELIVYGVNLFSYEPSPFQLKETFAYALLIFELLIILWGFFLIYMGIYTQTKNLFYSLIVTFLFNTLLIIGLIFISTNLI